MAERVAGDALGHAGFHRRPADGALHGAVVEVTLMLLRWPLLLGHATRMTLDGASVNMTFRFLEVPLLVCRPPDFALATKTTNEGLVEIKLGKGTVGIDVIQARMIGRKRGWM